MCSALDGNILPGTDWEKTLALANRTLVTPALADIMDQSDEVPVEVKEFVTLIAERTHLRNTMMRQQLVEAVKTLSDCGIVPILIKGASFLASGHSAHAGRLCADIDLLLLHDSANAAIEALGRIGFTEYPSSTLPTHGINLQRHRDVGGLDIHYRLRTFQGERTYEDIQALCRESDFEGASVLVPSPELQAAILIAHDQLQERDYWRGLIDLRHLVDLRNMFADADGLVSENMLPLFPPGVARRALSTQMLTLQHLFDIPSQRRFSAGPMARLQVKRRFWQIGREWTMYAFTVVSLLFDMPAAKMVGGNTVGWRRRAQFFRRMFAIKKTTKV
ncbi:MAG: nucleotidyltransferase family protein [Alteraurantiacibacter sp. bin_em_oilr2.035]|nr:nucleotidyltransferase family protein [Alteraurantiacibacter sp. bin_em_oilr2.035]